MIRSIVALCLLAAATVATAAKPAPDSALYGARASEPATDTTAATLTPDTAATTAKPTPDSAAIDSAALRIEFAGKLPRHRKTEAEKAAWIPDPQRALWLALVLPGAGQIYNRKYWKLPLFYGGMMGCLYAMSWNNMMYKDYSQAYLDIMDDDPQTQSYSKFLHLGRQIDKSNEDRYKKIFKSRKDRYRRWRDLSFFCLLGVYAVSVVDAYVDAMLSEFDITKDLSLKVAPTVFGEGNRKAITPGTTNVGVNCRLTF